MVGNNNGVGFIGSQMIENGYNVVVVSFLDDLRDLFVYLWGGLVVICDSMLMVLDCFLDGMLFEVF